MNRMLIGIKKLHTFFSQSYTCINNNNNNNNRPIIIIHTFI